MTTDNSERVGERLGGCDPSTLAREFSTPLLVIDEVWLRSRMRRFRAAFERPGRSCAVTYAGKALLVAAIARIADAEGLFFYVGFVQILAMGRQNKMTGASEQYQDILRDESMHCNFGIDLVNTIKLENPHLWTAAFREEMQELFRQAVELEYRYAEGRNDQLPALAADLVGRKVDVIVATGNRENAEARRATSTIPIVMVVVADPVGSKLVQSLARPGGNLTGVTNLAVELVPKRLDLLCEYVRTATVDGVVLDGRPKRGRRGLHHRKRDVRIDRGPPVPRIVFGARQGAGCLAPLYPVADTSRHLVGIAPKGPGLDDGIVGQHIEVRHRGKHPVEANGARLLRGDGRGPGNYRGIPQ